MKKLARLSPASIKIVPTLTALLGTPSAQPDSNPAQTQKLPSIDGQKLISSLSYSHFELLLAIDDDTKRLFYEVECIKGGWSVRELKRQINSLYYERSGLSKDKAKLAELANFKAEPQEARFIIKDPYVFEWFGLDSADVMSESKLEASLIKNLEKFLLELGTGFCFEARQKRITIGGEHYFVDLVFYHRILKCHVLIELKLEEFNHENIGQLNTYVSWYKKNMMSEGDNPPIGILLCSAKNKTLVEYALAGRFRASSFLRFVI
jgi:predicted nuclease of restriction endonuclease-like (RecB) superfamily